MEICYNTAELPSEVVKNFNELVVDPSQLNCISIGNLPVYNLGNDISKFLSLHDNEKLSSGSIEVCGKSKVVTEDSCERNLDTLAHSTCEKLLSRSASFPCSSNALSPTASVASENDGRTGDGDNKLSVQNVESASSLYLRSQSLPTPSKLVPALKGSREKYGVPVKKLTVTWAPDVYDPTPTAASHVATNRSQRHRSDGKKSKKSSKSKQKTSGKSSLGSRGKDKKQVRKYGGSSNSRCFKPLDDIVSVVVQPEIADQPEIVDQPEMVDFKIGRADPYCGTSFLKNNIMKLHFSVAEAT